MYCIAGFVVAILTFVLIKEKQTEVSFKTYILTLWAFLVTQNTLQLIIESAINYKPLIVLICVTASIISGYLLKISITPKKSKKIPKRFCNWSA